MRVFYVAGPGNVIQAHRYWRNAEDDPTQTSLTYSGQFADFCRNVGAEAYIVSHHPKCEIYRDGSFLLEHRPKPMPGSRGARYHFAEIIYGLGLVASAVHFKADIAVVSSGSTHYFIASLFRLAGIRVVPVLHNTLWPTSHPPTRMVQKTILRLDALFFRWASTATIGVSPECIRQVHQLTNGKSRCLRQFWPQFRREYFEVIPRPPSHAQKPFRILYAGSVSRDKGVFDLLEMAQRIEVRAPGSVEWVICGSGSEFQEFKRQHEAMGLSGIVIIRGWTSPEDLRVLHGESHASIVPTRSTFAEGMAKTVVEAVLAGRPVITSSVVPALEVLRPACVEAKTNDVDSYVEAILKLIDDSAFFGRLCASCDDLQGPFYSREHGFGAVLGEVVATGKIN